MNTKLSNVNRLILLAGLFYGAVISAANPLPSMSITEVQIMDSLH